MSESRLNSTLKNLNKLGVRVTRSRRLIIELIYADDIEVPFTTEEIHERIPQVGRATVYRTIKMLQESGFLCKVVLPGNEMAYSISDFAATGSHHHHAVCITCGQIRTFTDLSIENAIKMLSTSDGQVGEVRDHRIEIYDVCPSCQLEG